MKYCPKCRTEYRDGFNKCGDCNVSLVNNPTNIEKPKEKYGSLAKRFISTLIDSIIIALPVLIFWFFGGAKFLYSFLKTSSFQDPTLKMRLISVNAIYLLYSCGISLVYATFLIGKTGSTLGQKAVGLKVATEDERQMDFEKAFFRALAFLIYYIPYVGGLIAIISAVIILSSDKKQAIHDKICKTIVLNI